MRLAHLNVLPEDVLTRNCQYESDIVHAPAAPGASFSVSRITRRELRDHNPALTNAIVRPQNYLTKCLRNWLCHCVNQIVPRSQRSPIERLTSILIDDFEAHLAGGAGDDFECGFVVARV